MSVSSAGEDDDKDEGDADENLAYRPTGWKYTPDDYTAYEENNVVP